MATKSVAPWYIRDTPNATLKRTVWSSPQGRGEHMQCCSKCKHWAIRYPEHRYEVGSDANFDKLTAGVCQHLRIWAAYGEPLEIQSFFTCSYFERKEKGNG